MHPLIKEYGKELVEDLLDYLLITQNYKNVEILRQILIKNKIITNRTKGIHHYIHNGISLYHVKCYRNSNGKSIIDIMILKNEIPQLLKEIAS